MPQNPILRNALSDFDFELAEELLRAGMDINALNEHGETLLVNLMPTHDPEARITFTRWMLDHGADPRILAPEGYGPLLLAVFAKDAQLMRMLLEHGADPNRERNCTASLYEYADSEYRFEIFDMRLPEEPTKEDQATEEAWLEFLDRLAMKYNKQRPDYLIEMRKHGARSFRDSIPPDRL